MQLRITFKTSFDMRFASNAANNWTKRQIVPDGRGRSERVRQKGGAPLKATQAAAMNSISSTSPCVVVAAVAANVADGYYRCCCSCSWILCICRWHMRHVWPVWHIHTHTHIKSHTLYERDVHCIRCWRKPRGNSQRNQRNLKANKCRNNKLANGNGPRRIGSRSRCKLPRCTCTYVSVCV